MGRKRFLSILVFVLMAISAFSITAFGEAGIVESGSCGDATSWTLYDDGRLVVSGTGEVTTSAWDDHKDDIKAIVVEEGITSLPEEAFAYCEFATSVKLPSTLKEVSARAFQYCIGLEELVIPEGVETIEDEAFMNCNSLWYLQLPDGLIRISTKAFYNCSSVWYIAIPKTVRIIEDEAFANLPYVYYADFFGTTIDELSTTAFDDTIVVRLLCNATGFELGAQSVEYVHSEGEWSIVTPATCASEGTEHQICEVCGKEWTRTIPKTNHEWESDYTIDVEPTCGEPGSKSIHCANCDATKSQTQIDATGNHVWEDHYTWDEEPSCITKQGKRSYHCENCSARKNIQIIIGGYEHNWLPGVVLREPTQFEDGVMKYTCRSCKTTRTEPIKKLPYPSTVTCEVGGNKCFFKSYVLGYENFYPGKVYTNINRIDTPSFLPASARPINTSIIARSDNTMCVQWNKCTGVDGYILLRRVGSSDTYSEIYRTSNASTQYYIDKSANKKNTNYYYICVGYKKAADGAIRISNCSMSVVGITANSTKKNAYGAYAPTINYTSKKLMVGDTVQLKLNYNSKCFSTWTRWRSENSKVAKVSSTGLVTAVGPGTSLISGRTPDGRDVRCTITVVEPDVTLTTNLGSIVFYQGYNGSVFSDVFALDLKYTYSYSSKTKRYTVTGTYLLQTGNYWRGTKTKINYTVYDSSNRVVTSGVLVKDASEPGAKDYVNITFTVPYKGNYYVKLSNFTGPME